MKHLTVVILLAMLSSQPAASQVISTVETLNRGDPAALRAVLDAGADPHERGSIFQAPVLSLAAIRGDLAAVDILLSAGADPNQTDVNGMNALSAAVRSCSASLDLIARLIQNGADLENRSGGELTPLLIAAEQERTKVALHLIEAGADINAVSIFGEGVLNHAIYTHNADLITALMARDVDTTPLTLLFKTGAYYYPGFGARRPNATGHCVAERTDNYPFAGVFGQ